jgi:hypothetical protein
LQNQWGFWQSGPGLIFSWHSTCGWLVGFEGNQSWIE